VLFRSVPPIATSETLTVDEDGAVDWLLAGTRLSSEAVFYVITGPFHGILTGHPPQVTYTPEPDFSGADTFEFIIVDGNLVSDRATITLQVAAINDPPVAESGAATVSVGSIDNVLSLAFHDPDGDENLAVAIMSLPQHGVLEGETLVVPNAVMDCPGGVRHTASLRSEEAVMELPPGERTLRYTPDPGFQGLDGFSWMVSDGKATSATVRTTIEVATGQAPPVALDSEVTLAAGAGQATIALPLANLPVDSAVELVLLSLPRSGTLVDASGNLPIQDTDLPYHLSRGNAVIYRPGDGFAGIDAFQWSASHSGVASNTATVRVTVIDVDAPPEARELIEEVSPGQCTRLTLEGSDDAGLTLAAKVVSLPLNGVLMDGVTGRLIQEGDLPYTPVDQASVIYRPDEGFAGTDRFTFLVANALAESEPAVAFLAIGVEPDVGPTPLPRCCGSPCGSFGPVVGVLMTLGLAGLRRRHPGSRG